MLVWIISVKKGAPGHQQTCYKLGCISLLSSAGVNVNNICCFDITAEIQNYLLPYGSLRPTDHGPYGSQSSVNGSHHWCFYTLEILGKLVADGSLMSFNGYMTQDAAISESVCHCNLIALSSTYFPGLLEHNTGRPHQYHFGAFLNMA